MPYTVPGKSNTVGKQIERHLFKSTSVRGGTSAGSSEGVFPVSANENISIGAISIDSLGECIMAGSTPADAIAIKPASSGEITMAKASGTIEIPDALFTAGDTVFLTDSTPNLITEIPDTEAVSFVQKIGTALTQTQLLIEISPPQYIE